MRAARLRPDELRSSRPVRNPAVEVIDREDGTLLRGPACIKGLVRRLAQAASREPIIQSYELEEVGAFVWSMIDGATTFEDISKGLGRRFKMNRAEADASLAAFLQMLSERGLITLAVKP